MTQPFPQTMDFAGFNAPSRIEADIYDLIVEGEIPAEIDGRWYRATPDHQYPPSYVEDTYISGDGMISMFRIEDGHVDFKSRYVMTERLKNDRKARRSLYGRYRNPYTDDESVRLTPGRSAANTTPVFHAGRLLATKEDGRPIELDPDTLATIGEYDFGGRLKSDTVTAHVRIDYDTGYMYLYGYEAGGLATRRRRLLRRRSGRQSGPRAMVQGALCRPRPRFRGHQDPRHLPLLPAQDRSRPAEGGRRALGLGFRRRDGDGDHAARRRRRRHALVPRVRRPCRSTS